MYYFTFSSGFFYLFRGGAGFPYRERAGELDLHRSTGLLPDDMMQNRRTVMSHIISRRMDRCERRRRKFGDADIIKPNHRDVVRYSVSALIAPMAIGSLAAKIAVGSVLLRIKSQVIS